MKDLTPELRALVAKVAEMQGMPVGQWVAHVLRERAQAVVRGGVEARSGVPVVPPQRIDDLEGVTRRFVQNCTLTRVSARLDIRLNFGKARVLSPEGLSNLKSGLSRLGRSGIRAVPVDVDAV